MRPTSTEYSEADIFQLLIGGKLLAARPLPGESPQRFR
jgi:hypothetical protein